MRLPFLLAAVLVAPFAVSLVAVPPAHAAPGPDGPAVRSVMHHVVDAVVRPGYRALSEKAAAFSTATGALCRAPSQAHLDGARSAFVDLVKAWGRVDAVQFGPIKEQNRSERILFYPDPQGIGQRQIQAILSRKDEAATDPHALARRSVAAQGLTAADIVLFAKGSEALATGAPASFRCRYAAAIAANVAGIAAAVRDAWDAPEGVARNWEEAGTGASTFDEPKEAVMDVLTALMHGLEEANDVWIQSFFADTPARDTPKRAIFWRSAATMPLVVADLEGMRALFVDGHMADLLPQPTGATARLIRNGFDTAIAQGRGIREPLVETLSDIPNRQKFVGLTGTIGDVKNALGNDFGPAMGLSTNFSFADGD